MAALWSQEHRLHTAHALAVLLILFVIYWFDRWLLLGWLVLLSGLVAGLPVIVGAADVVPLWNWEKHQGFALRTGSTPRSRRSS